MLSVACEDGAVAESGTGPSSAEPGGRPPGRAGVGMRDMVGAVVILVVIVGVLMLVTRGCTFDPGGPQTSTDTAPSVDISAKLDEAAGSVTFPLRRPAVPGEWKPNSSSTAPVGTGAAAAVVVRVGWLTPGGRFVQLSQSGGDLADVVASETGEAADPDGTVDVDGTEWRTYPARRDEAAWTVELDGTVALITGSGTAEEFRVLARAVQDAEPLPSSR